MSQRPKNFQPTIVTDFNTFLNYCEKTKPLISKGKEFISRKFVFEINQLLTNPHEGLTNRNDQHHYPQIHLFYHLSLNGDLFWLDWSKKSKPCFTANTEQIERFRNLNTREQYLFLFQCFYVYSDFKLISQECLGHFFLRSFNEELKRISKLKIGESYGLSSYSKSKKLLDFSFGGTHSNPSMLLYGQYFGLWNITKIEGKGAYLTRTYFEADTIQVTQFGKHFLRFLTKNAPILLWNQPDRMSEGDNFPLGVPVIEKIYDYLKEGKSIDNSAILGLKTFIYIDITN